VIARAWLWLKTWAPWLLFAVAGVLLCWTHYGRALLIFPDRSESDKARKHRADLKARNDIRREEIRRLKKERADARFKMEARVDDGDLAGVLDDLGGRGAPGSPDRDGGSGPD